MSVKKEPRERPIIRMLLSACDKGAWKQASLDWVEDRQDGMVEVIATGVDGTKLALEHTLIQPFVGEKIDTVAFMRAFGRIEKNPELILNERILHVVIPVRALPKGCDWVEVGTDLFNWLLANHSALPKASELTQTIQVGGSSRNGPFLLKIKLQTEHLPGMAGGCQISRDQMPTDLVEVIDKALRTKVPKLARAQASKRILLLERDQISPGDSKIYEELVKLAPKHSELAKIEDVWIANTSILPSDGWVYFALMDGRGLLELLSFEGATLKSRRDDRPDLGPPWREF